MKDIYLYFQIHQPYRINSVKKASAWQDFFVGEEYGKNSLDMRNETIFEKVALSCYLPTTEFWLGQLVKFPQLKFSISFSGTFLEQCLQYPKYGIKILELFNKLIATNRVEILDETYYHSLAFLVDLQEYLEQIKLHRNLIKKLFNYAPVSFRNTELIYNNYVGAVVKNLGYETILIEDAWWNRESKISPNSSIYLSQDYSLKTEEKDLLTNYQVGVIKNNFKLILRNEEATDGVIFNADENRLLAAIENSESGEIGIFTDYEFLGEHSTEREKIFGLLENQILKIIENKHTFKLIKEARINQVIVYNCPEYSSWGHKERDITVWRGGQAQEQAFLKLQESFKIIQTQKPELIEAWRRLSTSCHFYFLGQKTGPDKEFVDLFSPYNSAEEALEKYLRVSDELLRLVNK